MPVDRDPDNTGERPSGRVATRLRRRRLAADGGGRFSRPLAAALILIIAGAAYLFWPRGQVARQGLGEQLSVITADTVTANQPRSGSVDIEETQQPLVAERPAGQAVDKSPPATTARTGADPSPGTDTVRSEQPLPQPQPQPARPASGPRERTAEAPAVERIRPQPTGAWAVQVGAYGNEVNADNLAARLARDGIAAQIRAASTPSGDLIYRVWIGWFESRDQAKAYAQQEKDLIGEAHPVHR